MVFGPTSSEWCVKHSKITKFNKNNPKHQKTVKTTGTRRFAQDKHFPSLAETSSKLTNLPSPGLE